MDYHKMKPLDCIEQSTTLDTLHKKMNKIKKPKTISEKAIFDTKLNLKKT